jgi:hypothetical protein
VAYGERASCGRGRGWEAGLADPKRLRGGECSESQTCCLVEMHHVRDGNEDMRVGDVMPCECAAGLGVHPLRIARIDINYSATGGD